MDHGPIEPPRDPDAMNTPAPLPTEGGPPKAAVVSTTHVDCPNCGYNLTGVAIGGNCPECGLMIGRGTVNNPNLPTNGNAVAAMVLGICSIVLCPMYGVLSLVCGPLAIYFAGSARRQIRTGHYAASSEGLATAGRVTGWIGLSLGLLALLIVAVFFAIPVLLALLNA